MRQRRSKSSKISETARLSMKDLLKKHGKPQAIKVEAESVDEYLARGGAIERLPGIGEAPFRRSRG